MKKLNDQTRKDDVVTFEQLGVDRLFVDESHSFKNLFCIQNAECGGNLTDGCTEKFGYVYEMPVHG